MNRYFDYPIKLAKQKEGGYLVRFPNFPEAITQGNNKQEAIHEAQDCLEEAVANRMAMKLAIPKPSKAKKSGVLIALPATLAAKAALYITMRNKKLTNVALAKKLNCDEKEVRRLLDPDYTSKFPRIEYALNILGQKLHIGIVHSV
ncbi:MAG: type II toxin-antitoxin system HicB family antitoxin [Gammaproteobacteria bacterium]